MELLEKYDSPNSEGNAIGRYYILFMQLMFIYVGGVICLKLLCELFIPRNRDSGTIVHSHPVS